ncbi:hypothetical protein [Arthrobacter sp. Br18]|uniref:hypothetical protein n=1 Tax=Arthrobacter sp. Br18 TaxID=1312954 RepID=UPI0012DEB5DF|nr:hypothetical protein [Arthrobacter sp. Br18]
MRPPRPEMSEPNPPPVLAPREPSSEVKLSGRLWAASFLLGGIALVIAFLERTTHVEFLRETANGLNSGLEPAELDVVIGLAFWSTLGALGVVLLLEVALVRPLLKGRGWVRWALLVALVLQVGAAFLATAFLAGPDSSFQPVPLLVIGQAVLACAALVACLLPGATRWFRSGQMTSERRPA